MAGITYQPGPGRIFRSFTSISILIEFIMLMYLISTFIKSARNRTMKLAASYTTNYFIGLSLHADTNT